MHQQGYQKAIALLNDSVSPAGFLASPRERDNYRRVWTRDGIVTGLASLVASEPALCQTFRTTLCTLFDHQHPLGFMPSSVSSDGHASYGGTVGRADNPSWSVIGLCLYVRYCSDFELVTRYRQHVERCLHVLDIWEYNGKHLVYVPQSGDWADEYHHHGYLLYDQLLRVWALRLGGHLFEREEWIKQSETITAVIRNNFWNDEHRTSYAPNLRHQLAGAPEDFWFAGFNPARIYHHFDLAANALALLLGIGDENQNRTVVDFVRSLIENYEGIVPAFHPSVAATDWMMAELENNYAYGFRNHPDEFHNGGLWPVWNGVFAAGLSQVGEQELAIRLTKAIHEANERDAWSFNECHHGATRKPIGVPFCTWSASGAVLAECAVNGIHLPSF